MSALIATLTHWAWALALKMSHIHYLFGWLFFDPHILLKHYEYKYALLAAGPVLRWSPV